MRDRLTISPRRYHQVAIAALVLLTLIVFSGAAVRLTGSGLGCSDWPRCYPNGPIVAELETHAMVEFSNRIFSALVGIGAIAAGAFAFLRVPRRRDLCRIGALLPLGVVLQGVLGGLTVKYELRPGFVMGHFILSMLILVAAWALYWRSRPGYEHGAIAPASPDRATTWAVRLLAPLAALMIFIGTAATAAGPHAGGRGTGDLVQRLYIHGSDTLGWAVDRHTVVGALLGLCAIIALALAWWRGAGRSLLWALGTTVALLGVQGMVGAVQYQAQLPAELVWVHVCLATLLWVAVLWSWTAAGSPPRGATQRGRDSFAAQSAAGPAVRDVPTGVA